jgi:hypothetical protein
MTKTLQLVDAKIKEVCTELMELSFGCEIILEYRFARNGGYSVKTKVIDKINDSVYFDGASCIGRCSLRNREIEKVLGHGTQLHHVLRAMATQRVRISYSAGDMAMIEELSESNVFTHEQSWKYSGKWNLNFGLYSQSPETIAFLLQVLGIKE